MEKHSSGSIEGMLLESVGRQSSRSSEIERLSEGSSARVPGVSERRCARSGPTSTTSMGALLGSFPLTKGSEVLEREREIGCCEDWDISVLGSQTEVKGVIG